LLQFTLISPYGEKFEVVARNQRLEAMREVEEGSLLSQTLNYHYS